MRAIAFARTSSLTGRDCQPDSRSSPRVPARVMQSLRGFGTRRAYQRASWSPSRAFRPPARARLNLGRVEPAVPLDLSGSWRAVESSGDLHHRFVEADFRDDAWLTLEVPGHWRAHPDLATSDGPVLYRRAFTISRPGTDRRAFLVFDGVFYDGDVWLDSTYLGATQGYFFPHAFEVTPQLHDRQEHVVAVEVGCATGGGQGTRRALTGVYA